MTVTTATASSVRNIISSCYGINPRQVKLMGELSPNAHFENTFHNGSMGRSEEKIRLWGFSPEIGIKDISDQIVGQISGSNYAHSSSVHEEGTQLYEVSEISQFAFFIVNKEGEHNWEGSEYQGWNTWEVFKAPNFEQHKNQLEASDLKRWEEWYQA
jgi:hypothetical protein